MGHSRSEQPNSGAATASGYSSWRVLPGAAAVVYFVFLLAPLYFRPPASDLDSSAQLAVTYAFVAGWQWGRDIVFAYAPLGFIYPRPFLEGALLITGLFWTAIGLALAVAFLTFLRTVPVVAACVLFVAFAIAATYSPDAVFFALPILAALAHLRDPDRGHAVNMLLAVIAGVAALIKLTFGVLSIVIFLALDFDRLRRKRFPPLTLIFLLTFVVGYLCCGQDLRYFVPFILQSLEHVTGYTEAMQWWGPNLEVVLFLLASVVAALVVGVGEWGRVGLGRPVVPKLLFFAVCGLVWLMVFKAGFVRHDMHSLTSWTGLSLCLTGYVAATWVHHARPAAFLYLCLAALFATFPAIRVKIETGRTELIARAVISPWRQLASARSLARDPSGWLAEMRENAKAHLTLIAREIPLGPLDGTVDLIPPAQAAVIANGLDYRPRPNLQDYIAYTPVLVDVNLDFIRSDRAPKYILHSAGTIDGRYPSLADGPMWPEFLRLYEPVRFEGKYLLLRRRQAPVAPVMSDPVSQSVRIGEEVTLPDLGPTFLKIRTEKTFIGKLAQLLFKPGLLSLTVKLANGSERTFRIVPGIVSKGFVLSPLVEDNAGLAALYFGHPEYLAGQNVVSMRVNVDAFSSYVFKPAIEIQVSMLLPETWRVAAIDTDIGAMLASRRRLIIASSSVPPSTPGIALEVDQLFAHAPARLSIPTPGIGKLTIGFGIRDGAWQGEGKTDGACFRIRAGADAASGVTVWEHCLRPLTQPGDRGQQGARLDIGPQHQGNLFLETDCSGTCNWDWTYWNRIDFAPQQ